jgi:hypothetical protein
MSDWNGKGSKSRVKDLKAYWNSPLWKKKEEMEYNNYRNCFVDDIRKPEQAFLYDGSNESLCEKTGIDSIKWDIVRSYSDFKKYIDKNGIPDIVSFDHDLKPAHYDMKIENMKDTGYECAEYLIKICKEKSKPIPTYFVHSASPLGRARIIKVLEDARI